jgi:large subunit ribosomal protein L7/L12
MSATTDKLIQEIEKLSVLELAELVKALEEKFGVSAATPVAAAPAAAAASDAAPAEEQSSFTVVLKDGGSNTIAVIKALREINPNLGLKEAKDLSAKPGAVIVENVNKGTAEEAKTKLAAAGATVELK